ncbi:hypothetical protein ACFXTH_020591 [Malus domestica]
MLWNGSVGLSKLYYGEYMNSGVGADTSRRVTWPGYYIITSAADVEKVNVRNFISGYSWISRVRLEDQAMEFNAYFLVFFALRFMMRYTSCGITAPCNQTPNPQPQLCHHMSTHHKKKVSIS